MLIGIVGLVGVNRQRAARCGGLVALLLLFIGIKPAAGVVVYQEDFNGAPYLNSVDPIYTFTNSIWRKSSSTTGSTAFKVNQAGTANGRLQLGIPVNGLAWELTAALPEPVILGSSVGDFVRLTYNSQFVSSVVGTSGFAQFRAALTNSSGAPIPFGDSGYITDVGSDPGNYLQMGASAGNEDPAMLFLKRDAGATLVLVGANGSPALGQFAYPSPTSTPGTLFGSSANRTIQFEANRINATQTRYQYKLDNVVVASQTLANSAAAYVTVFDQLTFGTGFNQGLDGLIDKVQLESSVVPLRLVVNSVTEAVSMRNDSSAAIALDYYEITSASDALRTAASNWNSFNDQNLNPVNTGAGAGESCDESPAASANLLSELFLRGQTSIAAGQSLSIGATFDPAIFGSGQNGDLAFRYSSKGQTTRTPGKVLYTTAVGVAGDYNNDGTVNAADFTRWRDSVGQSIKLPNDSTPGTVTQADYAVWVANFGQSAAKATVAAVAVPEPATMVLLGLTISAALRPNSRR